MVLGQFCVSRLLWLFQGWGCQWANCQIWSQGHKSADCQPIVQVCGDPAFNLPVQEDSSIMKFGSLNKHCDPGICLHWQVEKAQFGSDSDLRIMPRAMHVIVPLSECMLRAWETFILLIDKLSDDYRARSTSLLLLFSLSEPPHLRPSALICPGVSSVS